MSSGSSSDSAAAAAAAAAASMLKEAAYYIKAEQTFFSAMYAVCLWDWLVSLNREWHLIWKSKWSSVKVLYLLCRYWVIACTPWVLWVYVEDHSLETCQKVFQSPPALAMWNQLWAEGVLLIRTYALYGNKMFILGPLLGCLAVLIGYQLYVVIAQIALLPFLDPTAGGPCFPTKTYNGSPHIMAFFLVPLVFDTVVTGLALWRAFQIRRQIGGSGSPLLKTFVSEGIYYFFLMAAVNLANAIFYWQPKQVMSALLVPLAIIFPDILACRMILGLRERGVRHTSVSPNNVKSSSGAGTRIVFANMAGPNHELTTFRRDLKSVPFGEGDLEGGRIDAGPAVDIKVDVESHAYYETSEGDADEIDITKGRPWRP